MIKIEIDKSDYGGMAAINRWLSALGFIPNGDEVIAFSNSFKVCIIFSNFMSTIIPSTLRYTVVVEFPMAKNESKLKQHEFFPLKTI